VNLSKSVANMPASTGFHILADTAALLLSISPEKIEEYAGHLLTSAAEGGILHVLGNGGCASIAQHVCADFATPGTFHETGVRARTPMDNIARLTMWINDISWEHSLAEYARQEVSSGDSVLILSSSGGGMKSANLWHGAAEARGAGADTRMLLGHADYPIAMIAPPLVESSTPLPAETYESVCGVLLHAIRCAVEEQARR